MDLQPFYDIGPHLLLWAVLQDPCGKIMINGVPGCLNLEFLKYTEFTNVAAGCMIHLADQRLQTHGVGHFHNFDSMHHV